MICGKVRPHQFDKLHLNLKWYGNVKGLKGMIGDLNSVVCCDLCNDTLGYYLEDICPMCEMEGTHIIIGKDSIYDMKVGNIFQCLGCKCEFRLVDNSGDSFEWIWELVKCNHPNKFKIFLKYIVVGKGNRKMVHLFKCSFCEKQFKEWNGRRTFDIW